MILSTVWSLRVVDYSSTLHNLFVPSELISIWKVRLGALSVCSASEGNLYCVDAHLGSRNRCDSLLR